MVGIILIMSLLTFIVDWSSAIKWWCLFFAVMGVFALCIPDELVNEDFDKAIKRAPSMALKMVLNIFRLHGLKKKFLHTEHNYITSSDNPNSQHS